MLKRHKADESRGLAGDDPTTTMTVIVGPANLPSSPADSASAVVLEYCAAVRGILNDDQGGPLHPPGLRMAEALEEVRKSIQRNLGSPQKLIYQIVVFLAKQFPFSRRASRTFTSRMGPWSKN